MGETVVVCSRMVNSLNIEIYIHIKRIKLSDGMFWQVCFFAVEFD